MKKQIGALARIQQTTWQRVSHCLTLIRPYATSVFDLVSAHLKCLKITCGPRSQQKLRSNQQGISTLGTSFISSPGTSANNDYLWLLIPLITFYWTLVNWTNWRKSSSFFLGAANSHKHTAENPDILWGHRITVFQDVVGSESEPPVCYAMLLGLVHWR